MLLNRIPGACTAEMPYFLGEAPAQRGFLPEQFRGNGNFAGSVIKMAEQFDHGHQKHLK
ncbi:MAG: hypothetical protein VZR11_06655 [Succinimonas sp.]|jgi:hypothetical protein|nr:hypothetical protein [Succinimonas sp.]